MASWRRLIQTWRPKCEKVLITITILLYSFARNVMRECNFAFYHHPDKKKKKKKKKNVLVNWA